MQRLLATADWDPELVRDDLRGYVVEHLGDGVGCWSWTRRVQHAGEDPGWDAAVVGHRRLGS